MPREQIEKAHAPKDSGQKEHVGKEPMRKKEPVRRHGARKKTSEMTEEEKAAHLAEREARAAARKRERDRLAREAALAAAETVEAQKAPAEAPAQVEVPTVEAGPVFEEVTVPETFGFAEPPLVETDPAAFVQAPVSAEGPVVKTEPTPGESQEIPVFAPGAEADQAPEEESAKTQWDTLKDLETLSQDADGSAPAIPVMPQAEHTEVQVGEAVPAAPVQETKAPAGEETAAPQEEVPAEKPVETEEDLDALLSEIRDLLADSPVPKLDPEQLKKPPQPVPEVSIPDAAPVPPAEAPAADAAPASAPAESPAQAEPAPEIPAVEEPTIPMGEIPAQEIGQDAGQAPAEQVPASVFDEQPTQVIPTQEIAEEMQAQEEAAPQEELLAAVRPPRERAPRERAAARKPEKKTKKKGGPNVALILLSLVIVAAAAFIVVRNVVPAFQDGILGGGEPKAAEGLTLDRTALDLAEAGTTMALVPTFSPEGPRPSSLGPATSRRWPRWMRRDGHGGGPRNHGHHRLHGEWTEGGVYGQLHLVRRCPQSGARRDRACGQWSGRPRRDKAHPQRQRHYPGQRGGHPADYGDRRIGGGHLDQQRHQDRHGDCRRHHHRGGPRPGHRDRQGGGPNPQLCGALHLVRRDRRE